MSILSGLSGLLRGSLRAKWTLVLLVASLLPLLLLATASVVIHRQGLLAAALGLHLAAADHAASLLDTLLDDAAETTHRVGGLLTEPGIDDDEARLRLTRDALGRALVLREVAIYAPDGRLIDAVRQQGVHLPAPARQLAAGVVAMAAPRWLPPDYAANGALLRLVVPLVRDGARRAILVGTIDGAALSARLVRLSEDRLSGRGDGLLLLDQTGRLLAGGGGALPIGTSLEGRDVLVHAHIALPVAFTRPFTLATSFRSEAGEAMLGSLRSLPERGLAVAVRQREQQVYRDLSWFRIGLILVALLVGGVAILAGGVMAARTTRPIRALADLCASYGRRDFGARAQVHTGDELEALSRSLSEMASDLQRGDAEIVRRTRVEADLSRYLPSPLARAIAEGAADLRLGGERRTITVMFADVVSFTSFAEGAPPERVVAFLNELFTVMSEVVFRHGGTVDKFMGDCMMVLFGAPEAQEDHAVRALLAAEDLHRFVEVNAPGWRLKYGADFSLGIGLASGEAIVGNLGSEARMEYTAIGDMVNTAARLEGLARPGQTLVTRDVARLAGDRFTLAALGEHPLRGKQQTVQILELL